MKKLLLAAAAVCALFSCGNKQATEQPTLSGLLKSNFVTTVQGKQTALFVLTNKNGAEACVTNYGGRLVSLMVPDKAGKMTDVVLGYDSIADYVKSTGNFGALIGRYGNRIANATFKLDTAEYKLPANDNTNCLHGGPEGFDTRMWDGVQNDSSSVTLTYLSKDGEAGFPGNLNVSVTYTLTDDNAIDIQYKATTDKPTVINLTNHSYFNLSGVPGSSAMDQQVMINADKYTPVDSLLIPTNALDSVGGTPLDFRQMTTVGERIDNDFEQLTLGHGYDLNWVLNTNGDISQIAAEAYSPKSGIVMDVYTVEPGLQFYTGNFMTGTDKGKKGAIYPHRGALCMEAQHFPDSPNHPDFPSTVLRPGETYTSQCIYKFSVRK